MKFHNLNATFGKLHKQSLTLGDGLNIIEAPNEGGKSTWAGFVRAMLYGIDTRERDKKGVIAEKNRYQPWEGGNMEGSIDLCWKGKEITLRRTTPRATSPMGKFEAVYTGTEEPVPELTAGTVGETLTGVGRETFERSAFVGQSGMPVDSAPELERRVAAIVTSGQEDVSYSQAEKRLRDWRNRRQSNLKNGIIPRLEEERRQVSDSLERLEGAARQAAYARAQLAALEGEKTALEQDVQAQRQAVQAAARARYDAAEQEVQQARSAWDRIRSERLKYGAPPEEAVLRQAQGDLAYLNTLQANIRQAEQEQAQGEPPAIMIEHPVFGGMDPAAVRARAEADATAAQKHREAVENGGMPFSLRLPLLGMLLLAAAVILLNSLVLGGIKIIYIIIGVLTVTVFFALGIYHIFSGWRTAARIFAMLDTYGVREGKEIIAQAKEYIAQWEQAEAQRTEYVVRCVTRERMEAERDELQERLMTLVHTFAPDAGDLYGASAAISRALSMQEKERSAVLRLESAEKVLGALAEQGIPEAVSENPAVSVSGQDIQTVEQRLDFVRGEISRFNGEAAMAQGEMNTLGDPALLQARLGEVEGEIARRKEEYEALNLALEVLKQANAELQARFSPALNQQAGELLARLTGGKYDKVALTREFEALATEAGDGLPHASLTLSQGTVDQLYLAVRLAVCRLVLPGKETVPLILDDALVNFDDQRMQKALDLLREMGKKQQILLFTCQSRERLYLEKAKGVTFIQL